MKKYNQYLEESKVFETNFEELDQKIKNVMINNVITNRGLNFKKDSDEELLKKRKSEKWSEYYKDIDNIFKLRFEKDKDNVLQSKLNNSDYKPYHKMIRNILLKRSSN
jgi:hypothetical protein